MTNQEILQKAYTLRKNGQIDLADLLYDQLLTLEPNNSIFIFSKAVNIADISDTNAVLAISLFQKAAIINPDILTAACENITITARECSQFSAAISAFNELLEKYADNLGIIYQRAVNIGNNGDYLKALFDFYYVLDNSTLVENGTAFLGDQIATDIAFCKTRLRDKTNTVPIPDVFNKETLQAVKMQEYHYPLPAKLFGDECFLVDFGKMMGRTIKEIIDIQPDYIQWCILNIDNFCVSEDVIELIKQKGGNMIESEKINLFKLKIRDSQTSKIKFDGSPPEKFTIDNNGKIIT